LTKQYLKVVVVCDMQEGAVDHFGELFSCPTF